MNPEEHIEGTTNKGSIPARLRIHTQPLSDIEKRRLHEQKQLAETKLNHLEESLESLRRNIQWLRRWEEVSMAHEEEKQRLMMLNKQCASAGQETQALRQFENFEHMQGCYHRLRILEEECTNGKNEKIRLEQEKARMLQQLGEQEKQLQSASKLRQDAKILLRQGIDRAFEASKLERESELTIQSLNNISDELHKTDNLLANLEKEEETQQTNIGLLKEELERHQTGRQNMETHRRMIEQGENILIRLDYLLAEKKLLDSLKQQLKESSQRQDSENTLLGNIYAKYQHVNAQIETINSELNQHRSSIQGNSHYKLESRSQALKNRRQMLVSALSLWNRISTGYNSIEAKNIALTELNQQIAYAEKTLKQEEAEAARLDHLFREKEYTYNISKSQNVIKLRADLREGTACSVCGAMHHPYHSDTMLMQSKLIGEFKTEYELLAAENANKQRNVIQLRLQLAEMTGQRRAEEKELGNLQRRQQEDVREWTTYASLDNSFLSCTADTNREMRHSLLQQLIDNIGRDAETAQRELETFNYHQELITRLSEKLQKLEIEKNELTIRLGEVNTACQVMAAQTERLQNEIEKSHKRYSLTYEKLEHCITLSDWLSQWTENHEQVRNRIQQMTDVWHTLQSQIESEEKELEIITAQHDGTIRLINQIKANKEFLNVQLQQKEDDLKNAEAQHAKLVGDSTAAVFYQKLIDEENVAIQTEEECRDTTTKMRMQSEHVSGKADCYAGQMDEQNARRSHEQAQLFTFINNYNAHNAPVQYADLERVFANGKDWNDLRERVNQLHLQRMLSEQRIRELNSRITSLQAESGSITTPDENRRATLIDEYERQREKQRELMLYIARINILLEESTKQAVEQ